MKRQGFIEKGTIRLQKKERAAMDAGLAGF